MEPFFICFECLFYTLRGGYVKPFLHSLSFCFIRYEVGLCNPFNIFLLLFYMLRCGFVKPFIYFLVFGLICYRVGM